ncbi:MAG: glucosamine-6-phosphate deaminase [Planctomycetes bacterium]|nr:glucosamine-6-phosphate deaminase [Planctomycetota bacterium]
MRVLVFDSAELAARRVAGEVLAALREKPDLVLGLATGSTPIGVYAELIRAHRTEGIDFSRVRTFNLDEYLDLPATHEQSYRHFMDRYLFSGINVPPSQIHFPPSEGSDLLERCREYEEDIRRTGGIDIQILGIGSNGHIGFNEPTSSLASRTRVKTLTDKTLRDNSRFYRGGEEPPQLACTMGIGTILEAKKVILQAFGAKKADAVRAAVEGPVSSFCPGSALQLHPDVSFCLDHESASKLSLREYHRRVLENEERLRHRL